MARVSNKQMVEELQRGDRLGCIHLVDAYQEMLVSEAIRVFSLEREDAEEVVSDVLLVVVQKIKGFRFVRGDGDFHAWVMTIFRNRVRDHLRHRIVRGDFLQRFSGDPDENIEVTGCVLRQYQQQLREDHSVDPEHTSGGDKLGVIAETLDRMESWERVLLRCRALDVPYEDIARYTGKSVKQLKVYHARVKARFIKLLAEKYPELREKKAIGHPS